MGIITVICMYCHDEIGTKDGGDVSGVSHGICNTCETKDEAELKRIHAATLKRERFLVRRAARRAGAKA